MTVERHLILQELTLPPSVEWLPRSHGWLMARVIEGTGYWMQHGADTRALNAGDGLIAPRNTNGSLRASQLGPLKLQFFTIQPQYLNGLLTVSEWHQFEVAPNNSPPQVSIFTATEPVGQKFMRLADQSHNEGLSMRCALLQLWAGALGGFLSHSITASTGDNKLRERFRQLVGQMPEAELSECSLADLAEQLHCSERHFSRLFREEFGVPLRARQIELRLQRARQLLSDSNAKIINVAYESGYRHLGLFNAMFKKRFGMTPSECRRQNARKKFSAQARGSISKLAGRAAAVFLAAFIFNFISPAFAQTNPATRFDVDKYLVSGNTLLTPQIIGGIFTNVPTAFGTNATAEGICTVLNDLQTAYRGRGYATAAVLLPDQKITNATVKIDVDENELAMTNHFFSPEEIIRALDPAPETAADMTNKIEIARAALLQKMAELDADESKPKIHVIPVSTNAGPRFKVETYLVSGNSILSPQTIGGIFTNVPAAFGTNVTFDGIRATLDDLQMAYRERGFVTVSVGLPQQKLTNATVKVKVIEGRLAAINVTDNRWFSSNNVMSALPSLHTNMLLNSHIFQRELDNANMNRDRQIYPVIGPGPEPGTSELTLKVKDQFPLHARVEVNNQATPGTPDLRVNFNAQYDNLWDLEHQIGLQYSFTPEKFKNDDIYSVTPFDNPLVGNYSFYYRMPLGSYSSVQQQLDANPSSFGYNEVTHQFVLPPATGRPELTFYASRSVSDTGVKLQPAMPVTNSVPNPNFTITNQNSGETLILNENLGARFSLPLPEMGNIRSTLTFGVDYKNYESTSFQTNTSFIRVQIGVDSMTGQPIYQYSTVPQAQSPVQTKVQYLPLNMGWSGSVPDQFGMTFFNANANFNPLPGFSGNSAFVAAANGRKAARSDYVTLQLGLNREQKIYEDWTVKLHVDGQWATCPLINNEQFSMGGTAGVRGYTDGEASGDTGWRLMIEPQTPEVDIGMVDGDKPFWLRGSVFMDCGQIYAIDGVFAVQQTGALSQPIHGNPNYLNFCGAGFGMTANIGNHLDARLTIAWPLISPSQKVSPLQTAAGDMHVYFGIGAQF
jgi:hemolysin activation/secretion protein/AraC-like DNA-binding protein